MMNVSGAQPALVARIGAGAGFAGDRVDPAVALAASGEVDAVVLECLAERTLLPAIKARADNPQAGFDPRLRRRLTPLLPAAHASGCRIVSNLGGANPAAAGAAIAALAAQLGLTGQRIAAVEGDDVMAQQQHIAWVRPVQGRLVGAHAYLGSGPLSDALEQGANVVVTGRVADSALFAAVARRHLVPGEQALAGAISVGHLLECGGQLTGGNYEPIGGAGAAGNRLTAQDFARLGYPLADVYADGSADIRVLDGAPGIVDALTCSLQLLYEVHDPARYATPDLIVDFSGVTFRQTGPRQVHMSGARSLGPPPTLKVAGFLELPGFVADCEIGFAGSAAFERAVLAAETLKLRLSDWPAEDIVVDVVGLDSVLRAGSVRAAPGAELRVHVSARCTDLEQAQIVEDEVYALTLSGPAGGCSVRSERRPRIEVLDGFIAASHIEPRILWSRS